MFNEVSLASTGVTTVFLSDKRMTGSRVKLSVCLNVRLSQSLGARRHNPMQDSSHNGSGV
jgi:hypothetical protein